MKRSKYPIETAMAPAKTLDTIESKRFRGHPSERNFSFSLQCLFQIVTGVALFFAIVRFSPLLAMLVTLFVTPAIIRTGQAANSHYLNGQRFDIAAGISFFIGSIGIVVLIVFIAASVFLFVTCVFGVLGWLMGFMLSDSEARINSMMAGFITGTVWGMAGTIFAGGCVLHKTWLHGMQPKQNAP